MPLSVAKAQVALGAVIGSGTPATLYVALMLAGANAQGGGVEVSGGSYARVAVTNSNVYWTGPSATWPAVCSNVDAITFPAATADWGTVGFFAIYDAPTGGNLIWWGSLATSEDIPSGDTYSITAGNLNLALG